MDITETADSFGIMGNLGSHFAHLTDISVSADGRFLSSSDQSGVLVIRDTGNNFRRIRYYKATTSIRSITWMKAVPSALLLGCGNGDAHVLILNETAPDFRRLEIQNGSISTIATSDHGSLVAMAVGDYIVLADQDPHALEKAWSNIRRIRPPAVTSRGEIPLIQNLHIVGDDVIIVSHFEAVFGIRAISVSDPFEELWRIPLQGGTYIGRSAMSPSKHRMVITNTVSGLDIYSLKRLRYSGTVKYKVHPDRRIFGVAFLNEKTIVAADGAHLVFAEVGQEEPEFRSILPSADREILQLLAIGYAQDRPFIVVTHNLLSSEPREERSITVAYQPISHEADTVDAESSVKPSVKSTRMGTSPSPVPQLVELASGDQAVERLHADTKLGAPSTLDNHQAYQAVGTAPGVPPVAVPVAAPVAAPLAAPVVTPVAAPITAPAAAPLVQPVVAPVAAPLDQPVVAPVAAPIAEPVVAPIAEPVVAPIAEPVVAPTAAPVITPVVAAEVAPVVVRASTDTLAPVNVPIDNGPAAPRSQPWSPKIRTLAIINLIAIMLFFWVEGIGSFAHRSLEHVWVQQTAQTIEVLEASLSPLSVFGDKLGTQSGVSAVVSSVPLVSTGAGGHSKPGIVSIADIDSGLQELRDSSAPVTAAPTRIETQVITLTQVAVSTVTETQVVQRPPEAHTLQLTYLILCLILIMVVVVMVQFSLEMLEPPRSRLSHPCGQTV